MTKYTVRVRMVSTATVEVEAESYQEAIREAESVAQDDPHIKWTPDCIDACSCYVSDEVTDNDPA